MCENVKFQKPFDFVKWCARGERPPFIPSHPNRTYRNAGWRGWSDWLGCVCPKARRNISISNRVRKRRSDASKITGEVMRRRMLTAYLDHIEFVKFVCARRSDIEFRPLPFSVSGSYLFRIRKQDESPSVDSSEKTWIPLQLRRCRRWVKDGQSHIIPLSNTHGMCMIVLGDNSLIWTCVRDDLPGTGRNVVVKAPAFFDRDGIFDVLERWWNSSLPEPESDIISNLADVRPQRDYLSLALRFRDEFLAPLGFTLMFSGEPLNIVNAFIGCNGHGRRKGDGDKRFRVILRAAKFPGAEVSFHQRIKGLLVPVPESAEFDFLIVLIPGDVCPHPDGDETTTSCHLFCFPKQYLTDAGIMTSNRAEGKRAFTIFPPTQPTRKALKKQQEQSRYYASSADDFEALIHREVSRTSIGQQDTAPEPSEGERLVVELGGCL